MAVDIGVEAINRTSAASANYTRIHREGPAAVAGTITSIEIWAFANITGLRVGTFYTTNGDTLKCRDSEAIAGTITAGSKVTKAVTIAVEIGDYLGLYFTGGNIESSPSGYAGWWHKEGEHIDPNDEADYTPAEDGTFSLGGYITPPLTIKPSGSISAKMVAAGLI